MERQGFIGKFQIPKIILQLVFHIQQLGRHLLHGCIDIQVSLMSQDHLCFLQMFFIYVV